MLNHSWPTTVISNNICIQYITKIYNIFCMVRHIILCGNHVELEKECEQGMELPGLGVGTGAGVGLGVGPGVGQAN